MTGESLDTGSLIVFPAKTAELSGSAVFFVSQPSSKPSGLGWLRLPVTRRTKCQAQDGVPFESRPLSQPGRIVIHFHSVNASMLTSVPSLPNPLWPTPPKGTWGSSWMVVSLM